MEYTIHNLARMSGVSTRTLRYYDQIGLLHPVRKSSGGYRIYGENEVDLLQQILFYRELGMPLEAIGRILLAPQFDRAQALDSHLSALLEKKEQIEMLIGNVTNTIRCMKGEYEMKDEEKFEGFKQKLMDENEAAYGKELRETFGEDPINASNQKLKGMKQEDYQQSENLRMEYERLLEEAFALGDPAGETAQRACDLHRQWLLQFWQDGLYSKEAHKGLGDMYAADERFQAYYDKKAKGLAAFLRDALHIYCK